MRNILLIKKKDGKCGLVQDTKGKTMTIQKLYTLLLIPQLIKKLEIGPGYQVKYKWGYKNIRIWWGDDWKAAFITNKDIQTNGCSLRMTNSPRLQNDDECPCSESLGRRWLHYYIGDNMLIGPHNNPIFLWKSVIDLTSNSSLMTLYLQPDKWPFEQKADRVPRGTPQTVHSNGSAKTQGS